MCSLPPRYLVMQHPDPKGLNRECIMNCIIQTRYILINMQYTVSINFSVPRNYSLSGRLQNTVDLCTCTESVSNGKVLSFRKNQQLHANIGKYNIIHNIHSNK